MNYILVPLVIIFAIMTVISLIRGIAAFLHTTRLDLEGGTEAGITEMQLKQNRMMFARIKYQAAAVAVIALLLVMSH